MPPKWLLAKYEQEKKVQNDRDDYSESAATNAGATADFQNLQLTKEVHLQASSKDTSVPLGESAPALGGISKAQDDSKTEGVEGTAGQPEGQDALPPEDAKIEPDLELLPEVDDPETKDPSLLTDGFDMTKGAKLTLTFPEGLVI